MKLFELNNQAIGTSLFTIQEFPLNMTDYICLELVLANEEEEIPEHYKITFVLQEHLLGFDTDDFVITILQEDLQNNIPVAYAKTNVIDNTTEDIIDTIIYTIRFDSTTEEFKHLKDLILANITPTQNIVFSDLY